MVLDILEIEARLEGCVCKFIVYLLLHCDEEMLVFMVDKFGWLELV